MMTMMTMMGSWWRSLPDATALGADPARSALKPVAPAALPEAAAAAAATVLSDGLAPPRSATSRTWAAPRD